MIPLDTYFFPSWPTAPDPSVVESLTVILGIPIALALVILLVVGGPALLKRSN